MISFLDSIDNFNLTYAALLFPAIPLMMISFGNRYATLSNLIRKIHDELINKKISSKDKSAKRYLAQVDILNRRLSYVLYVQTLSGCAFIFNLLSILFGIFSSFLLSVIFFILALGIFSMAMLLFLIELRLAGKALKTHLEDLEEI